jgi:hypothetical protein
MVERPILMSAPMVRAVFDGKDVTRRVCKVQPDRELFHLVERPDGVWADEELVFGRCPYGQAGDRLWVRETWASTEQAGEGSPWIVYRATDPDWATMEGWKWRPAIFMKRFASRLLLEVKSVRLERLHAITEEDAVRAGVRAEMSPTYYNVLCKGGRNSQLVEGFVGGIPKVGEMASYGGEVEYVQRVEGHVALTARQAFASLWAGINGAGSWERNPLVWRVEFVRVPNLSPEPRRQGGAS